MHEAHKGTLKFYRNCCRLIPAIVHRQGFHMITDIHTSKLNLAKWVRRGKTMRDPHEITRALRSGYDFLFACAYCDYEGGYYFRYLSSNPEQVSITS